MNDTFKVSDRVLCASCRYEAMEGQGNVPAEAAQQQLDPTICINCGRDNEDTELGTVAGLPTCSACEALFRNRPFPGWIKTSLALVVGLVVLSLIWNMRFIRAYKEMQGSLKCFVQGDVEAAAALMNSASRRVPESAELGALATFSQGLVMLSQDKSSQALRLFKSCRNKLPPEYGIDQLILRAEIGAAFDNEDYDKFLELSLHLRTQNPDDSICAGQVASAYACKYALTGDEKFKEQSLEALEQARTLSKGGPQFAAYEQRMRILHRLHSREIIKRKEFFERFPNGWEQPAQE